MIISPILLLIAYLCGCSDAAIVFPRSQSGPVVYFKAYMRNNQDLRKGTTLKFDGVVANKGNGYSPHSGVFRAPISGIYLISVLLGTYGTGYNDILLKNENDVAAYISIGDGYNIGPMTTLMHVKKGNHVFVERGVGGVKQYRGWRLTQFSGYLLHAD